MFSRFALPVLLGTALLALPLATAQAQVFNETTDADFHLANATVVTAGTTSITGSVGFGNDNDVFTFGIPTAGTYTFTCNSTAIDPDLLLYNALGQGIGASDDQGGGGNSRITINLAAGQYYLSTGNDNTDAYDAAGVRVFTNDDGDANGVIVSGPTRPASYAAFENSTTRTGAYTIGFSSATSAVVVPEANTVTLLGLALPVLGVVCASRRRKK